LYFTPFGGESSVPGFALKQAVLPSIEAGSLMLPAAPMRKRFAIWQSSARRTLFCFAVPCSQWNVAITMDALKTEEWGVTVVENSATIIDFNTYKARRRMMLERPRDERREHPTAPVPLGFYLFWPVLAWVPIGLLLTPSTTEDFA